MRMSDSVSNAESARANRSWWDSDADNYHNDHPAYLGAESPNGEFYWCPEMLHEKDARLLGDVHACRVLELGCGSAPCARWLRADGAGFVTGFDISMNMLRHAGATSVPLVQADATDLPFADAAFDTVFSVFGAIPFVADSAGVMQEVARVLKPGGKFVFSVTHPMRWIFPDNPGEGGLTVFTSYFNRSPYVERNPDTGEATYVEHHRTLGDRIRELVAAGFVVQDVIEPEWPDDLTEHWGQWSPLRGKLFPGTAIFVARLR